MRKVLCIARYLPLLLSATAKLISAAQDWQKHIFLLKNNNSPARAGELAAVDNANEPTNLEAFSFYLSECLILYNHWRRSGLYAG